MSNPLPLNTTTAHSSFAGKEFSNNLLSDLAPLLTLFGKQVTKQFLSLSMGWADNILIAVGPLGIMTIIVSAIRVGGHKRFKAIIGRSRESKATGEAELLSSTSPEVCEMWNGQEIVRTFGAPKTKELIVFPQNGELIVRSVLSAWSYNGLKHSGRKNAARHYTFDGPNLTLNVLGSRVTSFELCFLGNGWPCRTIGHIITPCHNELLLGI